MTDNNNIEVVAFAPDVQQILDRFTQADKCRSSSSELPIDAQRRII